jgi:hypothetical protein
MAQSGKAEAVHQWKGGAKMAEPAANPGSSVVLDAMFGWYAVIGGLLVALAVVVWFLLDVGREARLLATEGREAEATVLDLREVKTRRVDNDGRVHHDIDHYARVRFDTPERRGVVAETRITEARFEMLEKGMMVPLRYAASDPEVIEFQAGEKAGEATLLRWAALGLAVIAGGLSVFAWRQRRKLLGALARGGREG